MFFTICLIVSLTLLIADYLSKSRTNQVLKACEIGGPKFTLPLIGNILYATKLNIKNVIQFLKELHQKYGKIYRFWSLNKCLLIVQDVSYAEVILSSQCLIKKSFFYDLLNCWLGNGLLLSTGTKWHKRRKIITPTFHFKILEQFVEIFNQQACIMVENLRNRADGVSVIDIFPVICSTTLDIIAESAMGVKINAQGGSCLPYVHALKCVAHIVTTRWLKPIQYFDLTFKLTAFKSYLSLQKNIKIMHTFTEKLIKERRSELMKAMKDGELGGTETLGMKKRMTFLDVLLQSTIDGRALTDDDIREEVDTFTFEGHDTTTSAISHILFLISRHPEVQKRLFDEIVQTVGYDKNKSLNMSELQDLKYLECVIKEGLRLYPSVPIISRITEEEFKIGNKIIPRNCTFILLIYAICRDPDYFYQPNDFIPERFLSNNAQKINPYAYIPFSAGPRNCIGQKFAILEMKCIICYLLRNYELLPLGDNVITIISLVIRSSTGVNIGLKIREY